jgi:hypothetical protein
LVDETGFWDILPRDGETPQAQEIDFMSKMAEVFTAEQRVAELTKDFFRDSEEGQELRREEYKQIVPILLAYYGEEGLGFKVDPWMAETYNELYKDRYNVRPREYSYRTMMAFMNNIPPLEDFLDDEDDAFEEEGDRFDPDISGWGSEADDVADVAMRARDFEEVYGVSAMGQAMRFMDMGEY